MTKATKMGKVFDILNDLVVDGRILLHWMHVGVCIYSDCIKCARFLIRSATVHFTMNPSVGLARDTVATQSHIDTPLSVALDTHWLHTATSTRHFLWR